MKSRIRIMGRLSVVLLICVLLGQGAWMYRVREMKVDPAAYVTGVFQLGDPLDRAFSRLCEKPAAF